MHFININYLHVLDAALVTLDQRVPYHVAQVVGDNDVIQSHGDEEDVYCGRDEDNGS